MAIADALSSAVMVIGAGRAKPRSASGKDALELTRRT